MTSLTLRNFAKKLGFKHHPKKISLLEPLDTYQQTAKKTKFNVTDAKIILGELGLQLRSAQKGHKCSNCKNYIYPQTLYGYGHFFQQVKLCPKCVNKILDGANLKLMHVELGEE